MQGGAERGVPAAVPWVARGGRRRATGKRGGGVVW